MNLSIINLIYLLILLLELFNLLLFKIYALLQFCYLTLKIHLITNIAMTEFVSEGKFKITILLSNDVVVIGIHFCKYFLYDLSIVFVAQFILEVLIYFIPLQLSTFIKINLIELLLYLLEPLFCFMKIG